MSSTLLIGLTGGIGSGKTTCAKIFEALGIPVYYSDTRAKKLMNENSDIKKQLKDTFGSESYNADGALNRPYLSNLIFQNKEYIAQINAIVHPVVRQDFTSWAHEQKSHYALQESALLFETGSYKSFNKNILVDADEDIRIQRVMSRDQVTAIDVRNRMSKQLPSSKKRPLADFIIENDGHQGLIKQIIEIHMALLNIT